MPFFGHHQDKILQYRNTAEILRYRFSGGFSAHVSASQSASAVKSRKYKCRETERIKAFS